jgi:hypothetical protein
MELGHKGHLNTRNMFQKRFFFQIQRSLPILDELKNLGFGGNEEKSKKSKGARAMDSLQDWR